MRERGRPVALVLTRQKVPVVTPAGGAEVARGAYVLADPPAGAPRAILIATGSEVQVALAAQELLAGEGVPARVVSMPCWEAFAEQPADYRDQVLPPAVRARVAVEAGATFGWERWIGDHGAAIGIDRFGASAPGPEVLERLGITAAAVASAVRRALAAAGGSGR
jgi:transketolase